MVPGNVSKSSCFRRSVHLYTVDVYVIQERWITLEYVILGEIVPPRRVIFLVSSKPYIYTCANDLIFKSSKAVAFKKEKHLSNVVSLFKAIKNV